MLLQDIYLTGVSIVSLGCTGTVPNTVRAGAGVYTGAKPMVTTIRTHAGVYTGACSEPIDTPIGTGASAKACANLYYKSTHAMILSLNTGLVPM